MRIVFAFLIFFAFVAALSPGCLPQQKKSSGNPTVLLTGNPVVGSTIYHDGKWWKVSKVSTNSEISWGRTAYYTELEPEK